MGYPVRDALPYGGRNSEIHTCAVIPSMPCPVRSVRDIALL
jgi:hypothetical protein